MTVGDSGPLNLDPVVSKPILDFAQKMSEDIITQALQLFWEVEIQYKDLPFIDSGSDYIIWPEGRKPEQSHLLLLPMNLNQVEFLSCWRIAAAFL